MADLHGPTSNMDVDYVVVFRYSPTEKQKAQQSLDELLKRLASVGFETEVRSGNTNTLLIFIRVGNDDHLYAEIYRSRAKDWMNGIRSAEPSKDTQKTLQDDPLIPAERLRTIYQLITNPQNEGGAGITLQKGEWEHVDNIFALHDRAHNKEWIQHWSTQWLLKPQDLDDIRNRLGEKIAYYFAFTQSYFLFLTIPAAFGAFTWFTLGHFSAWYAVVVSMWGIVFVEYWKHQEQDLAIRWGVRGVRNIESRRVNFKPKYEATDEVTGEKIGVFPIQDRIVRQLLQIPFATAAIIVLGSLFAACFAIEIFIAELYSGPGKSILAFLPTILLTTGLPFLNGMLGTFADRLSDYENYETDSQHEQAVTTKHFVLNFITSYLPMCLTAFIYLPFGATIIPYLDIMGLSAAAMAEGEKFDPKSTPANININPFRLQQQVKYVAITAQIVNFAMEVVVPYVKRISGNRIKEMQSKRSTKSSPAADTITEDTAEEKDFLTRVRSEAELEIYNVYDDLREMVIQYGYLSLFSPAWPLVPFTFLINNWIELRSDAFKICIEMQRPMPWRADTIGPWLDALSFLSWLGSITTAAVVYMFTSDGAGPPGTIASLHGWALFLAIVLSENLYLVVRWGVAAAIAKIDSPGRQMARREMYLARQKHFHESMAQTKDYSLVDQRSGGITRASLEDDARASSFKASTPEGRFWARQRGWRETAQIGHSLIEKAVDTKDATQAKKEL